MNYNYEFTAKELDNETQYTYFGARYYDSDVSVWLSVDPMAGKYPSLSPYAYCANNPVMLVDPNGMEWEIVCPETNETIEYTPNMPVPNSSSTFVSDAITGLNFLYNNPEGEKNRVADIANSSEIMTLKQFSGPVDESSSYDPYSLTITWDNEHSDIFEGGSQSPIIGLAHETDHGYISIKGWEGIREYESGKSVDYNAYMQSVSNAYMNNPDDRNIFENSAINYENFIGNLTVGANKLSTYQRSGYIPPIRKTKVKSIFSIGGME